MSGSLPLPEANPVDISIVVPVRNEAGNIAPLIAEIVAALGERWRYEIIYVNDGSTDATDAQLASLMQQRQNLRHIRHAESRGQSAAVRTGVRAARGAIAATLDGDGQNNPAFLPDLILALENGGMKYEVIAFGTADETVKAYESGRCDVFTSDISQLYAERLKLANPADHAVLPEVISKEPLGPLVRHGDDQWFDIVKWTLFAMINAEELGITQKNVDEMAKSTKPELKRVFGTDGNLGEQLGLTKDWVSRIVKAVGNYGESFDRNVGAGSKLGIARGLNQLWNKGGIQYAPPIR